MRRIFLVRVPPLGGGVYAVAHPAYESKEEAEAYAKRLDEVHRNYYPEDPRSCYIEQVGLKPAKQAS